MTNCYLLCDEASGPVRPHRPGDDAARVEKLVQESGCQLEYILLTPAISTTPPPCGLCWRTTRTCRCISTRRTAWTALAASCGSAGQGRRTSGTIKEGDVITVGTIPLRVMETPGHSEGSVCLLAEGEHVIFAGDTLFRCSCGRCDFPGGDYRKDAHVAGAAGRAGGRLAGAAGARHGDDAGLRAPEQPLHEAGDGAMKLTFRGHDDRYAVEQSLLALLPGGAPRIRGRGRAAPREVTLHEGAVYATGVTALTYDGEKRRGPPPACPCRRCRRVRAGAPASACAEAVLLPCGAGHHRRDALLGRADGHPPGQAGAYHAGGGL